MEGAELLPPLLLPQAFVWDVCATAWCLWRKTLSGHVTSPEPLEASLAPWISASPLKEGRSHPTICVTQTWQCLLHGFEAKPSILEQGWAGRCDHCCHFHIGAVWVISPAAHSPCGIAFRGVPALLGSLVIFITALQIWARSCNSFRSFAPLPGNLYRKAALTVLGTGVWIQGAGSSWWGKEVEKASYSVALKGSSVGSKNSSLEPHQSSVTSPAPPARWQSPCELCCAPIAGECLLCSQCSVMEPQEDHLYSLKSVAGQCSQTVITLAISCFYQRIILLARKALSLSCPAHWIKSTSTSIRSPSLSSLGLQEAEGRRENSWQMDSKKRSDKIIEGFSKWDWQQKGKQLKRGKDFKPAVSLGRVEGRQMLAKGRCLWHLALFI